MANEKVTSVDVAKLAEVSQSAVSRVFTPGASASKETVEKVRRAAAELGYRPNVLARSLITGRSRIIGLVVAYLENYFYPEAIERLSVALQEKGYHVLIFMAAPTVGNVDRVMQQILDYQVDGIVLASVSMSSTLAGECHAFGIPVVLFNRGQDDPRLNSVTTDNRAGGRAIADLLVRLGHARLAYIAGFEGASTQRDREQGFRDGLEAAGRELYARGVGNFEFALAQEAARRMFDRSDPPDAVFVCNDHMAFAVMDVLRFELGLEVPDEVSVVGFDDVPPAAWPAYDLTTFRQRVNRMVAETVTTLMAHIEGEATEPRRIAIDGILIERGIHPQTGDEQDMKGFDAKWRDVPHFIIGITREIWEDREIASLTHRYAPGLIVRSPASVAVDNSRIIAATMATLAEFPDRELLGEDVIWCEDPARASATTDAYLSSHRLICTATHTRPGVYGTPTGKRVAYRILADCAIRDDHVYDEWLIRDQSAIVKQLGHDVVDWTRDLIAREGGPEKCVQPMTPANDVAGPYDGRGNDNEWGGRYADIVSRIMSADLAVIPAEYDRAVALEYAGGQSGQGWSDADQFWLGLRAAFPDAEFRMEHVIGRDDPLMPPRAALRWSLHGKHSGWGRFGTPTGAEVYVMGMSQAEFGPFGNGGRPSVRREWTLIDETAIWKQILLKTGAVQ